MLKTAPTCRTLWTARLKFKRTLDGALAEAIASSLEEAVLAVSLHNQEATDGDNWTITLTTNGPPDSAEIAALVGGVSESLGLPPLLTAKDIEAAPLPNKDWLQHVYENFPPLRIGGFFIYGSHYDGEKPAGLIPLQIDAATAFGSGEHETTQGCIQALDFLAKDAPCKNALDMGCGSGILAIALTKLWPDAVVAAVDIDPESVIVTDRHAEMNGVSKRISTEAGDGYRAPLAGKRAPYDIVTANILANPLIEMAPALHAALKPGGYAVLSGLLRRQKEDVLRAHEKLGLRLVKTEEIGEWLALILQK